MGTLPSRNNASFEKRSHITDNVLPKDQDPKCDLDYSQVPLLSPVQCSLTACGAHRNMNLQRPLLVPKGGTAVTELGLLCMLFIFLQSQTPSFLSSFLWSLDYSPAHSSFSPFTSWLWIPAIMSVIYFNILAKHLLIHIFKLTYSLQVESCVSQDSPFTRG